jgi:phenylalanyl-tRNA synthetase beta chain
VAFACLSRQPALVRDFSLVFPSSVSWASLVFWIHREIPAAESVELFDVFTGGGLPADRRSLAFRVTFRHAERTLSDAEAHALHAQVIQGMGKTFQAELRAAEANPAP